MLGLIYLLASFSFGFFLVSVFWGSIRGLTRLAASFLVGIFCFSWLTFVFSLFFSFTNDPLRLGILGTLGVFLGVIMLFRPTSEESWLPLRFSLPPSEEGLNLAGVVGVFLTAVFSFWLMGKSFGYNEGYFRIASNIFDDFNVHLSIIRSFSLGKNFPPQLPFFAGEPLKYHFLADFCFAIFEALGWPINWAVNVPSALAFTSLLVLIYSLAKRIFNSALVGFLSVSLFLFNSSLTWVKFFQNYGFSWQAPQKIWQLGQYLSAGPFDGGTISIFWNLNTFVNQRHLIFGLGVFLLVVLLVLDLTDRGRWIFAGVLLGLLALWHGLVFVGAMAGILGIWSIWGLWGKRKFLFYVFLPVAILALPQLFFLRGGRGLLPPIKIGFLVAENLSLLNLVKYWIANLGLACLTIPAGFFLAPRKAKNFYLPFLSLFILPNLFQFSPNLFHNHSLLNSWIIISNFYSAYFLVFLFRKKSWEKRFLALVILGFLGFSGIIDLMVIKNDFIHRIPDYHQDKLVAWIKDKTLPESVFLSEERLYHPANLAGRRVYLGSSHFVWGYGVETNPRKILTSKLARSDNREEVVGLVEESGADYWLTEKKGFGWPWVYEDEKQVLYEIKN